MVAAIALLTLGCAVFDTFLHLTVRHGNQSYPTGRFARVLSSFLIAQILGIPVIAFVLTFIIFQYF
jgi:hypothetical protein